MSETVVHCEGFHDRAFWAGWLLHLGCADPGLPAAGATSRSPIFDPWNTEVKGGQFAFLARSSHFIRVVPCHGKGNILRRTRIRLGQRGSKSLTRLIVNVDPDVSTSAVVAVSRACIGLSHFLNKDGQTGGIQRTRVSSQGAFFKSYLN